MNQIMNTIRVVFSGGPMNLQLMTIADTPEYYVNAASIPNEDGSLIPIFTTHPDEYPKFGIARYSKTSYIDKENNIIFEFRGIE